MPVTLALPKPALGLVRSVFARSRNPLLSTLLMLSSAAYAVAQDAPRGLSQLDFDRPGSKGADAALEELSAAAELTPEQVKAVVAEAVPAETPQKPALKPGYDTAPDESSRARLAQPEVPAESWNGAITKTEWVRTGDGSSHFLPPRLKGPAVDKSAPNSITTEGAWAKHNGGCQEPKDLRGACAKAGALKELFSRFSGSDDVYTSQCAAVTCPDPTHEARLTGFAIAPKKGGEFRMLAVGDSCHYQLEAPKGPGSWVMLEGVRGSCSCVPKSCS